MSYSYRNYNFRSLIDYNTHISTINILKINHIHNTYQLHHYKYIMVNTEKKLLTAHGG